MGMGTRFCGWPEQAYTVLLAGPQQIALFRAAVAADESGRTLEDLVSSLAADGHEILGDVMKRVPRGCLADHLG